MWQWTNHFEPTLGVAQTNSLGRHLLDEVTTSDISSCSALKLKRKKTRQVRHIISHYSTDLPLNLSCAVHCRRGEWDSFWFVSQIAEAYNTFTVIRLSTPLEMVCARTAPSNVLPKWPENFPCHSKDVTPPMCCFLVAKKSFYGALLQGLTHRGEYTSGLQLLWRLLGGTLSCSAAIKKKLPSDVICDEGLLTETLLDYYKEESWAVCASFSLILSDSPLSDAPVPLEVLRFRYDFWKLLCYRI